MNSKWQERKARSERNGCKIGCENYMNLSVGIYGKYGRYRYPQNVKYRPDISVRPIIGRALLVYKGLMLMMGDAQHVQDTLQPPFAP